MNHPKVSIIMGIYNCEKTLDEAIQSILTQTYKDWEMILCDDGSTDSTLEIAKSYTRLYPEKFVLLVNAENQGLNITLNRCLQVSKGEYIARMDGDDISLPTRLEKEVCFLDQNNDIHLVSMPMIHFDEHGEWGKGKAIPFPQAKDFVFYAPCFCHAPCMIRRDAILSVGGYTEDKRLLRFEDCDLWYKLYSHGYRGANLQEHLYKMRDDRDALKRRTAKTRMMAVYVQGRGYRMLRLPWYYYPVLVKDFCKAVFLSCAPSGVYQLLHKIKLRG